MKVTFLEHIKEYFKKAKEDTTNKISALATKTVEAIEEVENQKADTSHKHSAGDITSGTLSVARGGTGATTAANARTNLGITPANIGAAASSHGTHVTFSTTAPVMDGTASVGTATTVARSDHKHPTDTSRAAASHTHNYAGSSSAGGAATSAVKLQTARTIRTNLASTSTASFDGTANVTPGVTGTLPIANGGTGNTTGKAATATKLATARTIDGMNFDGSTNIVHFGVCSTAADVAAKTVSLSGFVLAEGARVAVFFTTTNTASSLTLNVNGTGAKAISCIKGYYAPVGQWEANQIVEFVYYSSHWIMLTANARRLTTARSIRTNLGSTSASNFDGTANITPGVTGTLPIANGGTGSTTVAGARNNLGLGNTSGALPIANGGTGATTASTALSNLGGFPKSGGTISGNVDITGNVRLKGSGNFGNKLNFGDSEYVYISEPTDDNMEIKAKNITMNTNGSDGVTINKLKLNGTFTTYNCTASGNYSHAEGAESIASGSCSHAEGYRCKATGEFSYAKGAESIASGNYSHAEGNEPIANGDCSHAEGYLCIANGDYSHAEGSKCIADGKYGAYASGLCTVASNHRNVLFIKSISGKTITIDSSEKYQSIVLVQDILKKFAVNQEIYVIDTYYVNGSCTKYTISSVNTTNYTITVDRDLPTSGFTPWVIVNLNVRSDTPYYITHTEGRYCISIGDDSHAEGGQTVASGSYSHTEGRQTVAYGTGSHAEGRETVAKGGWSHASGYGTIAYEYGDFVMGQFNKNVSSTGSTGLTNYLTIGNGTSTTRSNCFRVTHGNGIFANAAYKTTGADYTEYFEWKDDNPENEDRVGLFVTLIGERIQIAKPTDKHILGIVSACPSILGDVYDDQWKGMYEIDIYGRPILEEVEVPAETIEIPDPENPEQTITQVIREARKEIRQKPNPDYDPTQEYIPRSKRPEWDAVGMMGKLVVIDDGTCKVNGWCTVGYGGIATSSEKRTKFRVMARLDETHIKIMIL